MKRQSNALLKLRLSMFLPNVITLPAIFIGYYNAGFLDYPHQMEEIDHLFDHILCSFNTWRLFHSWLLMVTSVDWL